MDAQRWATIQAAFDELVELDEASRASRLAALGSTDPELKAAVESLLAADAEASARLASLEAGFLSEMDTAPDPLDLAGRTVSHFHVLEPLGAGGMGVVYRAQDTRLGRTVALKFLLPPYNLDAAAKKRFLREGHSAAALDHPNLCTIHEVGESADGRLFLAMALYPGETLKARLAREGPLRLADALEISRQIAQGLVCAHAAGIVHRDLKPGNVMLLPDGTVKILDFGLAKARDHSASETGARLGTVSYMAPEQIRGQAVDGRADLWALGVVLYEMLTGRKPFAGEHEVAVAHAILHDEPVSPRTLRAEISSALEDLVLTLLQKDPGGRCPTADELLVELRRVEAGRASAIRAARARWRRARRTLVGHRRRIISFGVALLAAALGYGAIALSRDDELDVAGWTDETGWSDEIQGATAIAERTAIAVLPFKNLSPEGPHAYLAPGLHDEILTQLYKVPALKVIGRTSVMGYAGPHAPPLRQIARELRVGSVVDATVQVVGERVRVNVQLIDAATDTPLWVEQYDRTLDDAFALQSDVAQRIVNAVGAELTRPESQRLAEMPTSSKEAYLFYLQGLDYLRQPWSLPRNFEIAEQLLTQALALDPDFALAHAALSEVHGQMYWYRNDKTPARLARQRAEAEAALRLAPALPEAHRAMAQVHGVGPDFDPRLVLEEIRVAVRGAPNDAAMWERLAGAHRRLGNWDSSLVAFNKALELSPLDWEKLMLGHGAWTNTKIGRFEEAIRWLDRALSLHPDNAWAKIARAWTYAAWQGQLDTLHATISGLPPLLPELRSPGTIHDLEFLRITRQPDSLLHVLETVKFRVFSHPFFFLPTSLYAAWAHEMRGNRGAAVAAFDSALVLLDSAIVELQDDWPVHWARGMALAGLGRRQEALREARWLQESAVYRKDAFFGPTVALAAAEMLAHAGEADAAVDELDRVLAEGAFGNIMQPFGTSVHALRLNPSWDPIREHPRFKGLLAKYQQGARPQPRPRPSRRP